MKPIGPWGTVPSFRVYRTRSVETLLTHGTESTMSLRTLAAAAALLLSVPSPSLGQNVAVDEGAFRLYVDGQRAGREEFSVRQVGSADQGRIILRGTVSLELPGGRINLAPAAEAASGDLEVSAYQIKVSGSETTDIFVSLSGRRYLSRTVSARGEELREFRAGPGSVLLDDGVAHHHHLLTPFLDSSSPVSLSILTPRAQSQVRATLSLIGREEVRVGQDLLQARHFRLDGGDSPRDIWFDDRGRILRVEIPSRGYVAERESLD